MGVNVARLLRLVNWQHDQLLEARSVIDDLQTLLAVQKTRQPAKKRVRHYKQRLASRDTCPCGQPKDVRSTQCRACRGAASRRPDSHVCPDCGETKMPRSSHCRPCWAKRKTLPREPCPHCGGPKKDGASACRPCYDRLLPAGKADHKHDLCACGAEKRKESSRCWTCHKARRLPAFPRPAKPAASGPLTTR